MPKQLNESASFGEPAVTQRGPLRQAIIDLSREVGFAGGRDEQSVSLASASPVTGLFKKMIPQRT
jgi:pilus assembly protein CpaE